MSLLVPPAIEAPHSTAPQARRPLLPDWLSRPSLLLWAGTLPQIILLLVNLRAYGLITGELSPGQRTTAFGLFTLELGLLVAVTAAAALPLWRITSLSWRVAAPLFAVCVAYLWTFMVQSDSVIPASVSTWMLPREMLLYYQFIFVTPLAFYTGMWLACRPTKMTPVQEGQLMALTIIGLPSLWSGLGLVLSTMWSTQPVPLAIAYGAFTVSTIVVLAAFARACVTGFLAVRRAPPAGRFIFLFLIALAGPLGGLWLNYHIPFPSDFQSWPVYVFAGINGGLLLLTNIRALARHRALWLAQCLLFPFTLYFFVVFLPFLPLSLFCMIIFGAGFLILAPTALFLVHGQRLLEGHAQHALALGRRKATLLALAAMAVLPALYVGETLWDRVILRGALDYVFAPDYRHMDRFRGSRDSVRRSLEHLRDFKAGLQLPFLSGFYNWAVFDNLTLPDEKINALHQAFFGQDLPEAKNSVSVFGGRPSRGGLLRERPPLAPPVGSVNLDALKVTTTRDGPSERTSFQLELLGTAEGQNEFAAEIKIPDGVFVSGFWLTIGQERVPGRLFEKKAAMWVYQRVTSITRHDPAILVYRDAHTLDLRVFPITGRERRFVELEILYPSGLRPEVLFPGRSWRGEGAEPTSVLAATSSGSSALVLSADAVQQLPPTARAPYLHFIIDRSAKGVLPDDEIVASIRETALKFPAAHEGMLTWTNYDFSDLAPEPVPLTDLAQLHAAKPPARRGGFLAERAVKRALLAYHDRLAHAAPESPWLKRYPIYILLGGKDGSQKLTDDLLHFQSFAPDANHLYATPEGTTMQAFNFAGSPVGRTFQPSRPVALLKAGDAIAPHAISEAGPALIHFESGGADHALSVLEGAAFRPLAATATLPLALPYSRGVDATQRALGLVYNPSLGNRGLADIVALSREAGIMLAATSYVVMENSAQWEMLKRKEQQKLKGHSALELEQLPEPTTALLLLAGGAAFAWPAAPRRPPGNANLLICESYSSHSFCEESGDSQIRRFAFPAQTVGISSRLSSM